MKGTPPFRDKMTIRVSVIIPCYNQARFLREALQSVLEQDYPDKEVIVVNDGSTDKTWHVAAAFSDRIVYIEQANRGAASARNAGIRVAGGEYIAFLDADDVCLPGRLKTEVAILDQHPEVGLVATDAYLIDSAGQSLGLKSALSGAPRNPGDFRWETVEYCATTSTVMARRICFDVAGYFDDSPVVANAGEDWLQWVRISHDFSMRYLGQPTVAHRLHGTSLTSFADNIDRGNRLACHLAVNWDRFSTYPAHFRAKLLFYRFATAWRAEPKRAALAYFLRAVATDPGQLNYALRVIRQGLINTMARRRRRA